MGEPLDWLIFRQAFCPDKRPRMFPHGFPNLHDQRSDFQHASPHTFRRCVNKPRTSFTHCIVTIMQLIETYTVWFFGFFGRTSFLGQHLGDCMERSLLEALHRMEVLGKFILSVWRNFRKVPYSHTPLIQS